MAILLFIAGLLFLIAGVQCDHALLSDSADGDHHTIDDAAGNTRQEQEIPAMIQGMDTLTALQTLPEGYTVHFQPGGRNDRF